MGALIVACTSSKQFGYWQRRRAGGATTINVTLQEFSVILDSATAPAGENMFHVTNDGPGGLSRSSSSSGPISR